MHILFVTETYFPEINGVARTVQRMCHGLSDLGHAIYLIHPKQEGPHTPDAKLVLELCTSGIPLPGYPGLQFGLPANKHVRQIVDNYPIDAVYVATEGPLGRSALSLCREQNIPVLSGMHTNFHQYSTHYGAGFIAPLIMGELRRFHNKCNGTLVPTKKMAAQLQQEGFERLHVWSRGVDIEAFNPRHRAQHLRQLYKLLPEDLAVLYVGRIAPEKNIDLAFEAFAAIKQVQPTARFILVGDGPARSRLTNDYPEALFVGTQVGKTLAEYYASGDIFLFPSLTDTFGNVVLEALASGLAVVSYDMAAASELIEHGKSGLLSPVDNASQFIEHAAELARQPDLLARLKNHAVNMAAQHDWVRITKLLEEIFLSLIQPA